ncbi:unnamed protein product [Hymenolepis diminuta]|uniref:Uncharacterized protein n=1 Tax=Hymenolepis diminuta TaxID=6216 RepID=A0A564Y9J4_HYMDI|nr:unnamed protein product [Hymenolepis diminuta]
MIKSPKCSDQCNHNLVRSILVCPPKRLAMADYKYKEPEGVGLIKPISIANEAVSKVVAQIAGEAILHFKSEGDRRRNP